ncbi:MAG: UDP-N-acetylglucosamine 2-epimerase (non-hydrolyzing) [Thermoplasmatales archaeon]|nr:UDP-N-acetylglucosamine 2-epimerase (non-hydrolyzing) [Thermoplasmatales archaeon]
MKVCIVVGTRPEIIKMSPVIRECEKRKLNYMLIHTGQHYSYNMDKIFFDDLEIKEPKYKLDIGKKYSTDCSQAGEMIKGIEKVLTKEKPDIVLVEGDTNSVLAGAISSVKLHIKTGHVEAGLRSFDRGMPEEINRILTDHCSDLLFAPTKISKQNLLNEGISKKKIFVTGNTIVDAIHQNLKIAKKKSKIMNDLGTGDEYALLTVHRQENVDVKQRFSNIILALTKIDFPVIFPIHPRSRKMAKRFKLYNNLKNAVRLIEPVGYLNFLNLLSSARLVLTDSGGIQEEACILNTPCLTLRDNTERPETIEAGANYLVGTNPKRIVKMVNKILNNRVFEKRMRNAKNPFGDGRSGRRIIQTVIQELR